jgi:hypothetical protein
MQMARHIDAAGIGQRVSAVRLEGFFGGDHSDLRFEISDFDHAAVCSRSGDSRTWKRF